MRHSRQRVPPPPQQNCPAQEPGQEKMSEVLCEWDASGVFISFSYNCRALQFHLLI